MLHLRFSPDRVPFGNCAACGRLLDEFCTHTTAMPDEVFCDSACVEQVLKRNSEWLPLVGNCKDCKHWGNLKVGVAQPVRAKCFRLKFSDEEYGAESIAASAAVCSDEIGEPLVSADFGCVLWEGKEANEEKPR